MLDQPCPNCRSATLSGDQQSCHKCGWLPLRATEMVFLDVEELTCPQCGRARPVTVEKCPTCADSELLNSTEPLATRFGLEAIFALTALVGFCIALSQLIAIIGIPASILAAAATVRTSFLIRERRSHGYPITRQFVYHTFGMSAVSLCVACICFAISAWICGMPVVGIMMSAGPNEIAAVVGGGAIVAIFQVLGLVICAHIPSMRGTANSLFRGAAFGFANSLCCCLLSLAPPMGPEPVGMTMGLWIVIGYPLLLIFASSRLVQKHRCGSQATAFHLGASISCWIPALAIALLTWSGLDRSALVMMLFGIGWIPATAAIVVLQQMWSWDDAFPSVLPNRSPAEWERNSPSHPAQEGISFVDEMPR